MGLKKGPGGGILAKNGKPRTCCCGCLEHCDSDITVTFTGTPPAGQTAPQDLLQEHTLIKINLHTWRKVYEHPWPESNTAVTLSCSGDTITVSYCQIGTCNFCGIWEMTWTEQTCPSGGADWVNGTGGSGFCGSDPDWSWATCTVG